MNLPDTESMFSDMASIPKIARGKVWCTVCGRSEHVNGGSCLRHGWPRCCGYTMTIDSPEERYARTSGEKHG